MERKRVNINKYLFFQEGPGVRNTQYTLSGVKLLNVANLVDGKIDLSTSERYISIDEAYGKYKHFLVDEGDLIVASSGIKVEYMDKKMGFITKEHLPLCMNTSTIRFKSLDNEKLDIRYFMYFLKSSDFKKQLNKYITGSAQLNYGPSHLKQMTFLLVTKNEQLKIINILEKTDKLVEKYIKELEAFDNLIKSRFVEMFGNVDNPKYDVKKLGEIAKVGSSHRVFTEEFVEEGIPFYRGTEIGKLANGEKLEDIYYISKEHYERLACDDSKPQIGDLLMPSICDKGQVWMVDTDAPFYYKDGRVLSISPDRKLFNSKFLQIYMKNKTEEEYPKLGSGSTFAEFKIFILKDLNIIVPPMDIQNDFASFVEQVDKSKFVVQQALEKTKMLMDSLMQEYFG